MTEHILLRWGRHPYIVDVFSEYVRGSHVFAFFARESELLD